MLEFFAFAGTVLAGVSMAILGIVKVAKAIIDRAAKKQ